MQRQPKKTRTLAESSTFFYPLFFYMYFCKKNQTMKKIILTLFIFVVATACSCNGRKANDEPLTSNTQQYNNYGLLSAIKYSKSALLKADYEPRYLYHENTITIEWPVSSDNIDIKQLQEAILQKFEIDDSNIDRYTEHWAKHNLPNTGLGYTLVDHRDYTKDGEQEAFWEDDDTTIFIPYDDTDHSITIEYAGTDTIKKIITFNLYKEAYSGCGMGACVIITKDFLIYDYNRNKSIVLSDIVADTAMALVELQQHPIYNDIYDCITDKPERLPKEFRIAGDTLLFAFDKYEIGCGSDGSPDVGFDVKRRPSLLTAYGRKLFGID